MLQYLPTHFLFALCLIIFSTMPACEKGPALTENKLSDSIPALLDRDEKLRYGKEWDDVMSQYQKLKLDIQKNAQDYESLIRMANLFIREARITGEHGHYYPAALLMTDRILSGKSVEKNMEFLAFVTKAGVQLSLHEFSKALETGQKALLLNNRNAQVYGVLTDCYVELGQYDKAVQAADMMISIKPDLRSYARISYLREIHGNIPEAIEAMKMAVAAGVPGYEDTAWAMLTLAELYERYGSPDKAKKIYEEILATRPDYPFAIAGTGAIYLENNQLGEAEKLTLKAIDIIPEVGFYTQLAEIYKKQGKKAEMDKTISEIFVMLEEDEKSGHNMNLEYSSIYLDLLDNPDKALSYATEEYNKRPENIDVNRMMARVYQSVGNDSAVKKHLAAAGSTNSRHPELAALAGK
jgi:tetratricopeptide (TPR) repeat protein